MHRLRQYFATLLVAVVPMAGPVYAEDTYIGLEGGYKTGDFGTDVRTNLYSLSFQAGVIGDRFDASLTLPYLSLEDEAADETESGVGDFVVRGGYILIPGNENDISLSGSLAVKLPTADEDTGLGTGETDIGGFLTVDKQWPDLKAYATGGYIKVGDPETFNYDDVLVYGAGALKRFTQAGVYASLEGQTASVEGADDVLETHVGGFYFLNPSYTLTANAFLGLTDGGPDGGASVGVVHWF